MPFTPSHIAAVLPLRGRRGGGMPFAALAVGAMSPDLLYFQSFTDGRRLIPDTHSLIGIFGIDLVLGFVVWLGWRAIAAPAHELMPAGIRDRWRVAEWPTGVLGWALAVLAILVGTITHVCWDEFTHPDRFGTEHFAILRATYQTPVGPQPGYLLLQLVSGVIGLALICWVGWRQPLLPATPPPPRWARFNGVLLLIGAVFGVLLRWTDAIQQGHELSHFRFITSAMSGAALTGVILTLIHLPGWHRSKRSSPDGAEPSTREPAQRASGRHAGPQDLGPPV